MASPSINVTVKDASNLQASARDGIGLIQIPTQRGEHANPVLITSELDFFRKLGGHHAIGQSDLATMAILMARQGLPLYVSRIGHYTDITDKSTLVGCKASGQQAGASVTEAITGGDAGTKKFIISNIANAEGFIVPGVKIVISGSTGNDGVYTVTDFRPGVGPGVFVCEPIPSAIFDGDMEYYTENFVIRAGNVGTGYNGSTATIQNAASGNLDNCDIIIRLKDSPDDYDYIYQDVPRNATQAQLDAISGNFQQAGGFIKIGALDLTNEEITLTGGDEDLTLIDATDYTGDLGEGTGLHSFDSIEDGFRLVNLVPLAAIDTAYTAYAELRKDIRVETGVPLGANASGIEAYLDANPLNSSAVSVNVCDGWIIDPRDTAKELRVPGVLNAFMCKLKKDGSGKYWFSAGQTDYRNSGLKFTRLGYDIASPANKPDYDTLYAKGANAGVSKQNNNYVYFGGRSSLLDLTKLSKSETIADLLVYIGRELKKTASPVHFQPNDPISWRQLYSLASAWIKSVLVAGRAIYGPENTEWFWIGDQNADFLADAVYNSQNDLLQGKYKAQFIFKPIDAMKEITLFVTATNSNIVISE
jgi:hypothetical protein